MRLVRQRLLNQKVQKDIDNESKLAENERKLERIKFIDAFFRCEKTKQSCSWKQEQLTKKGII